MRTIDAHHHFWKYTAAEYGWIGDSMAALRRDFLQSDLRSTLSAAGVDAAISLQARQSLEETEWLLGMADQSKLLAGVVGWVPLLEPGVGAILECFTGHAKLKGVRHIVQGEPDDNFLLRDDFNRGIREVTARR